jgi:hypothetical protein
MSATANHVADELRTLAEDFAQQGYKDTRAASENENAPGYWLWLVRGETWSRAAEKLKRRARVLERGER